MMTSTLERSMELSKEQPILPLFRLLSIAVGFFGIQYAWAVQYSQMSTFLEALGSGAFLTALIWCAGPITGTFTQPILGSISDRTWTWLGSRRPFLLLGAIVCAICMILMPNSLAIGQALQVHPLLVAGVILWIWDTSINVCQGPIRWLVVDVVNKAQQPLTFSLMGFVLAIGAAVCFYLGSLFNSVHLLFYVGAAAMLVTMGWTIFSTPETQSAYIQNQQKTPLSLGGILRQSWDSLTRMHPEAKKLCWANGLTWFGGQCMFVFFPLFVVHQVYHVTDPNSALYAIGRQHVSACWLAYYIVCFVASLFVGRLSQQFSMKGIHSVGLLAMAGSLFWMFTATSPLGVLIAMGIAGIGWATTMAIPFAWAAQYSPEGQGGSHLATFNIYIAFASFIANLIVGQLVSWTGNESHALLLSAVAVMISVMLFQSVKEKTEADDPGEWPVTQAA